VAVLIDEYDAPILAQIESPELAKKIRDAMRSFYAVLKDMEDYRGFTFITGVTKFAKTSIFSTLNNLEDLTLDKDYATICGLTMAEFDSFLEERQDDPNLKAFLTELITLGRLPEAGSKDKFRQLVLDWYDGYSWDGRLGS
jgi:hypothetical protein